MKLPSFLTPTPTYRISATSVPRKEIKTKLNNIQVDQEKQISLRDGSFFKGHPGEKTFLLYT